MITVAPTGGNTGIYNAKLTTRFVVWNEQANLGEVFDSSICFELPNGARQSPGVV
ncbi:Uma2 family endonuclease [Leptothermofonsia sp. ETS-13]|uniref:Uma2 family endonuclease n=1 Tax=Leptothermofonsia sp. ETS-13 TaxID=3035696 RepID=UPI003B9F8FD3